LFFARRLTREEKEKKKGEEDLRSNLGSSKHTRESKGAIQKDLTRHWEQRRSEGPSVSFTAYQTGICEKVV